MRAARIQPLLLVTAALAMTLASGFIHGDYTGRWRRSADIEKRAEAIERFSQSVGDWQRVAASDVTEEVRRELQLSGARMLQYRHRYTAQTIHLAVLMGPPGPLSAHTPEICYSVEAYAQLGDAKVVTVTSADGSQHHVWKVSFAHESSSEQLDVFYTWNASDGWQAPTNPRMAFGSSPYLYKVQVAAPRVASISSETSPDAFLAEFLEVLDELIQDDTAKAAENSVPKEEPSRAHLN